MLEFRHRRLCSSLNDRNLSARLLFDQKIWGGGEDEKRTGTLVCHYQLLIYSSMLEFEHRRRVKALRERGLSARRVWGYWWAWGTEWHLIF